MRAAPSPCGDDLTAFGMSVSLKRGQRQKRAFGLRTIV